MVKKLMGGAVSSTTILLVVAGLAVIGLVIAFVVVPAVNKSSSQNSKHSGGAPGCSSCPHNNS
uniref:Uncharacterized protein n=1 Tax=viral metagenome TaxID=1070528 RepID=A0A6C0I787_9ZZZZ